VAGQEVGQQPFPGWPAGLSDPSGPLHVAHRKQADLQQVLSKVRQAAEHPALPGALGLGGLIGLLQHLKQQRPAERPQRSIYPHATYGVGPGAILPGPLSKYSSQALLPGAPGFKVPWFARYLNDDGTVKLHDLIGTSDTDLQHNLGLLKPTVREKLKHHVDAYRPGFWTTLGARLVGLNVPAQQARFSRLLSDTPIGAPGL
jgi:hypothetical protein